MQENVFVDFESRLWLEKFFIYASCIETEQFLRMAVTKAVFQLFSPDIQIDNHKITFRSQMPAVIYVWLQSALETFPEGSSYISKCGSNSD